MLYTYGIGLLLVTGYLLYLWAFHLISTKYFDTNWDDAFQFVASATIMPIAFALLLCVPLILGHVFLT